MGCKRVLVLGAGLAGLSAAERLVDAGLQVTLVDAFPLPGGRVASFELPEAVAGLSPGDTVEHGLHAFFQHYHGLYGLMARAGLDKPPFIGDGLYLWNPRFGHYQVEGGPLFWLFGALGLPKAIRGPQPAALKALLKLTAQLPRLLDDAAAVDAQSALTLLQRFSVPQDAIDNVFRPCLYSLTSLALEELSALELLRWMSAILPDPRMRGLHRGGSQALCMPISDYLVRRGVDVRFGVEVERISLAADGRPRVQMTPAPDRTGVRHVLVPGFAPAQPPPATAFDAVVSALPRKRFMAVADASIRERIPEIWAGMARLQNIHPLTIRLWFTRPLHGVTERYVLAQGTVFDVLRPTKEPGRAGGIRLLDALVENIDAHLPELGYDHERYIDRGPQQQLVLDRVLNDLERLYPGQVMGNPLRSQFVHTREGIVACNPGTWPLRPPAHLGLGSLFLAGDFTAQPHGVCMEGAVQSGRYAAQALLSGQPVTPQRHAFSQVAYSAYSLFADR